MAFIKKKWERPRILFPKLYFLCPLLSIVFGCCSKVGGLSSITALNFGLVLDEIDAGEKHVLADFDIFFTVRFWALFPHIVVPQY